MAVSKTMVVCIIVLCGVLTIGAGAIVFLKPQSGPVSDQTNTTNPGGQTVPGPEVVTGLPAESFMVSEGSPEINITSPFDDRVPNGTILIRGSVTDTTITSITRDVNGNSTAVPVNDSKFSTYVNLSGPSRITLRATNAAGATISREILLDGDLLSAPYEKLCGFDPLDPDSDATLTAMNEADNGDIDGFEMLDGWLPAFAKFRVHAGPFKNDTDGDGLTDGFEILRLIPFCMSDTVDTDNNGIPDPKEDIDKDSLTNLDEQKYGTNPLNEDSDHDGLKDIDEINCGTKPQDNDSDGDGVDDGTEVKLGMDPLKPDGNAGASHAFSYSSKEPVINLTVAGTGDITRDFRVANETAEYYNGWSPKRGPVATIFLDDGVERLDATMPYPPAYSNPENLAIFYYNETIGMYLPVDSVVDERDHTVKGSVALANDQPLPYGSIMVTLGDVGAAYALNLDIFAFNYHPELAGATIGNQIEVDLNDSVNVTAISAGSDGKPVTTVRAIRFLPNEDEIIAYNEAHGY